MADATAAAKAARAEDQKVVAVSRQQYNERMRGKPTPTQEECDLIKLGAPVTHKEDSGAGPDSRVARQVEAVSGGGGYTTRTTRASSASSSHSS